MVRNNAKKGADIAVELAKLRSPRQAVSKNSSSSSEGEGPLVVGGSILDFVVRLEEGEVSLQPPPPLRFASMAAHIEAHSPPVMEVLGGMLHLLYLGNLSDSDSFSRINFPVLRSPNSFDQINETCSHSWCLLARGLKHSQTGFLKKKLGGLYASLQQLFQGDSTE